MKKEWVLLVQNSEGQGIVEGPYTSREAKKLIYSGRIKYTDKLWKQGWTKWKTISEQVEFLPESTDRPHREVSSEPDPSYISELVRKPKKDNE